jgi:hypothetical protein
MEIMVSARPSLAQVELVTEWAPVLVLIHSRTDKSSWICLESKRDPSDVQPVT